jgi:iron complex outermembrane receptor protein
MSHPERNLASGLCYPQLNLSSILVKMQSHHPATTRRHGHFCRALAVIVTLAGPTIGRSQTVSPSTAAGSETVNLPKFEVTGSQDNGYRASNSVSATRINTPIRDLPLTVEAFTEDFIKDIQPRDLLDIVSFAPGVSSASGDFAGGNENFNIRGFSSGNPLRNGFKGPSVLDPATIARVEVVRGPSSLLYGTLPPGGLVNYITKRPLDHAETTITQRIGTENLYRTELDLTGPLGGTPGLAYRLIGSYDHNQQFFEATKGVTTSFAPTIQWRTANSTLTLDYQHLRRREDAPIFMKPFFVTPGFQYLEKVPLPQDFNALGDDDFRGTDTTAFVADWQLQLAGWDVRANFAYARQTIEHYLTATLFVFDTQRANPTLSRTASFQTATSKDETGQIEATRTFKFKAAELKFLTGYQLNRRKEYFGMRAIPGSIAPPSWDLLNPATWNRGVHFDLSQLSVINDPAHIVTDNEGVYAVGNLSLLEGGRLGLLGGLRYSKIKSVTINDKTDTISGLPINQTQTSPQAGIIFKLTPAISAYASYSESFVPTGGAKTVDGVVSGGFDPTIGKGYDVGLKA